MKLYRLISIAALSAFVAACGGSSSGSFDNGGTANMNITPAATSIPANPERRSPDPDMDYTVQVRVRFTQASGDPVADGTSITLTSENVNGGVISPIENPEQTGASATVTTSGGLAQFWFTSGPRMGPLTLTASGQNPSGAGTVTSNVELEIIEADDGKPDPDPESELSVEPAAQSVPANPQNFQPNPDMDYTIQVNVKFTQGNGDPVDDGTQVSLTSSSSTRGVVSPLNSPLQTGGSATAVTTGGQAQFWFTSGSELGSVTLTAQADDPNPDSSGNISATADIEVVEAADGKDQLISVSAEAFEVPANPFGYEPDPNKDYTIQVNVQFNQENGSPVADGTDVTLTSDSVARAKISNLTTPTETGASATTQTSGGQAQFLLTSGPDLGAVGLTASGTNPANGETVTAETEIQITEAEDGAERLRVEGSSTMPANTEGVDIFLGSPFVNELTIRYTGPDGNAGEVAGGEVSVAVSPVSLGAFSTLDDPDTEENDFLVLLGSGPVNMTAGVATLFVHSADQPGTLTVSVSAQDAETSESFSNEFEIEIIEGAADFLPASLSFPPSADPLYIKGSGGATSKSMSLLVTDSGDNPVPDPEGSGAEYNNVTLSLDAPEGSDARLTGTGAEGSVSGTEINVQTVNGVANFSIQSGAEIGTHTITATVDRADNNVDNDLLDPLTAETSVEVGDGQLFSLELQSPNFNAIRINSVSGEVISEEEPEVDPETGLIIPPDPDGTYSLRVTAQGTDKVGNPVISAPEIAFGKIDAPLTPELPREFVFSGMEGDPEEAGTLFTATNVAEGFLDDPTQPDEAVEPGDTLLLFGDRVAGNREHEASRIVDTVVDESTVTVTEDFNANDPTGSIVDDGAVIPWVIGRSRVGTIDEVAHLDEEGRTSVWLTYPIGSIGRPAAIWAQGRVNNVEGTPLTVAAVEPVNFPGAAPLTLTVTPNQVAGNQAATLTVCLQDGLGAPVSNVFVSAAIAGGTGSASIDGLPIGTGEVTTADPTGSNGCLNTVLQTQGMPPDEEGLQIVFFVGTASDTVLVVPPGSATLSVSPSRFVDQFQGPIDVRLSLQLTDSEGAPITSVPLQGTCPEAGGGLQIARQPGLTNEDGQTSAVVRVNLFSCTDPIVGEFQCEFTTSTGSPVGVFTAVGLSEEDLSNVSPACPD